MIVVVTSMDGATDPNTVFTSSAEIGSELYGDVEADPEFTILSISDDSKVYVDLDPEDVTQTFDNIQFFIKDIASNSDDSMLLIHSDLVKSGVVKEGDGIRISYVDENDSDFFDTNWFNALEALEAADAQMIVPLPSQAISCLLYTSPSPRD